MNPKKKPRSSGPSFPSLHPASIPVSHLSGAARERALKADAAHTRDQMMRKAGRKIIDRRMGAK